MASTASRITLGTCAMGVKLRRSSPNSPSSTPSEDITFRGNLGRYSVRLSIDGRLGQATASATASSVAAVAASVSTPAASHARGLKTQGAH
jgi:hypothetical protein